MKTTEVNKNLIGRRCECIFTGMMVTGVIEDIEENKYSVNVKVHFDKPQQWGDDLYTEDWAWGRKTDEFGTLHHLPFATVGRRTGLSDDDSRFR